MFRRQELMFFYLAISDWDTAAKLYSGDLDAEERKAVNSRVMEGLFLGTGSDPTGAMSRYFQQHLPGWLDLPGCSATERLRMAERFVVLAGSIGRLGATGFQRVLLEKVSECLEGLDLPQSELANRARNAAAVHMQSAMVSRLQGQAKAAALHLQAAELWFGECAAHDPATAANLPNATALLRMAEVEVSGRHRPVRGWTRSC